MDYRTYEEFVLNDKRENWEWVIFSETILPRDIPYCYWSYKNVMPIIDIEVQSRVRLTCYPMFTKMTTM